MPLWSVNQHLVTLWSVKKAPCGTVVSKPAPCGTVVSYQAPCGTVDSKPEPFGTVDSKPAPCGTVISFPAPCGTVDSKPASCATVISEPAPCGTVVSYPASCGAVVSKQTPRGTVISKPAPRGTVVSKPAPSYSFYNMSYNKKYQLTSQKDKVLWNSMSSTLIVFDLQGCFAFKGKKKIASIEDYFHGKDDTVTWKNRLEVFQNLWEAIDTEIQILQADLNTKIFDDLLKFASVCHCSFTLDVSHQISVHKEIPTAALVTGVNTPDHAVMFSTLVTLMQERVSPHIAKLRSKDCNNVKNILTKTLEQFLQKPELFQDEDEASDINKKKLPCTLSTLAAWYKEHYTKEGSSPKKKKSLSGKPTDCVKYPPVVIIVSIFKVFDVNQILIQNCFKATIPKQIHNS
ncbi:hypothetical protein KUTeg_007376 [Tegillarca granosa]|uniref:Origin recognition complex subunit 3 N-terminal domain-containing protein n=1 Tax=Tegillarca granosa TaxID=220873 RepID=A0ABQ9FF28_TEGGR|nr:hypothetical protein KUTeg_007376 [Tegillarca granosa]